MKSQHGFNVATEIEDLRKSDCTGRNQKLNDLNQYDNHSENTAFDRQTKNHLAQPDLATQKDANIIMQLD